jgi:hypothetical protein
MKQQEQHLQRALRSCAEQAIPETLDLWPRIRAQAAAQPSIQRANGRALRLQRVPIALLLILLLSGIGCATSVVIRKAFFEDDRGLSDIEHAGLVHDVNQSETIDDVTVTVQRVYLDARRLAIGLTVHGAEDKQYFIGSRGSPQLNGIPMRGSITISGSGDWKVVNGNLVETEEEGFVYDVQVFDDVSAAITQATLVAPGSPPVMVRVNVTFDVEDVHRDAAFAPIGPFNFHFDVPIHPSQRIELHQTQQAAGIAVTLEDVLITPSLIEGRLCFDPQASGTGWQPDITVRRPDGWLLNDRALPSTSAACHTSQIKGTGADHTGVWTLTVNRLEHDTKTVSGPWTFEFTVPKE